MPKSVIALIGSALVPASTMLTAASLHASTPDTTLPDTADSAPGDSAPPDSAPPDDFLPSQPIEESFTVDACGFEVRVEITGERVEVDLGDTTVFFEPGTEATLTNIETGASVTVDISGPGIETVTPTDDGGSVSVLNAFGSWIHPRPNAILHTDGRWTARVVFDADGNVVEQVENLDRVERTDLCGELS